MTEPAKTLILVHGAWHGSWCWSRIVPLLQRSGVEVRTADLPSTRGRGQDDSNLSSDAMAVRALMDDARGDVFVCGHSYGGMVISHPLVGNHPRLAQLIYLCAFMPDDGESLMSIGGGALAPWINTDARSMTLPDLSQAGVLFYADCDVVTRQWAIDHLQSQPVACFSESISVPSWRRIPSAYVVCAEDMALPPDLQRRVFAPKADDVIEMAAGHSPFLSRPEVLADLLTARVDAHRIR